MSKAGDFANILLAALIVELRKRGADDDLCAVVLHPGEAVTADYGAESCGGIAWVQLTSAAPTTQFPTPIGTPDNCTYSLAYGMEMGILRPAPMPEVFGEEVDLPSDEDQAAAAHRQYDDLEAMHEAIRAAQGDIENMVLGTYSPMGPEGGVVGGAWALTVGD